MLSVEEDKTKLSTLPIDGADPDADWGKHETSGVNAKTGKIWKKVKSWFGLRPPPDRDLSTPTTSSRWPSR